MQSSFEIKTRTEEIARFIETRKDQKELEKHLQEIVEGSAFRGSQRSAQFLLYVMEQAIGGNFEALKERVIGVRLFGRPATYDTGEDAIVRVTASDVRRRLQLHYSAAENPSGFHICLPPGSYLPEITRQIPDAQKEPPVIANTAEAHENHFPEVTHANEEANGYWSRRVLQWLGLIVGLIVVLNIAMWVFFIRPLIHVQTSTAAPGTLPWSAFFAKGERPTMLITSDPNIAEIQGLTGVPITVSDYANREYIPNARSLPPEIVHFCNSILRGDKAANVDTSITAKISALAARDGNSVKVYAARNLQFSDLDTDNNMIFLGSPRSDPWTSLFNDQMDFRINYNNDSRQEIIYDVHPHPGEQAEYVPTAKGYATGRSYATVSYLQNPNRAGQVLVLEGANAEGTEAAGDLVTDVPSLTAALKKCGIQSPPMAKENIRHFQILLRLNMMAGSPVNYDVLACHTLP